MTVVAVTFAVAVVVVVLVIVFVAADCCWYCSLGCHGRVAN